MDKKCPQLQCAREDKCMSSVDRKNKDFLRSQDFEVLASQFLIGSFIAPVGPHNTHRKNSVTSANCQCLQQVFMSLTKTLKIPDKSDTQAIQST